MHTGSAQQWSILPLIRFLLLHIDFEFCFLVYSLWLAENTINCFIGQTTGQGILTLVIFSPGSMTFYAVNIGQWTLWWE